MVNKMMTRLDSKEWSAVDEERVGYYFRDLGFSRVGEVLGLRMFDLFNMDRIDNIRAWEMIRNLYTYLDKNVDADKALEWTNITKPIAYRCQRLHLIYAGIHIAVIWRKQV